MGDCTLYKDVNLAMQLSLNESGLLQIRICCVVHDIFRKTIQKLTLEHNFATGAPTVVEPAQTVAATGTHENAPHACQNVEAPCSHSHTQLRLRHQRSYVKLRNFRGVGPHDSSPYENDTCRIISVLDSIVADPHIQIRVAQYGRWINFFFLFFYFFIFKIL